MNTQHSKSPPPSPEPAMIQAVQDSSSAYRWDRACLFANASAWEQEFEALSEAISGVGAFRESLTTSGETLFHGLQLNDLLHERMDRLKLFAELCYAEDTSSSAATELQDRAQGLFDRLEAETAFIKPLLLSVSSEALHSLIESEPKLSIYQRYFVNVERERSHTRSAETEKAIAILSAMRETPELVHTALNCADLSFEPIQKGADAKQVNQGTIDALLADTDPNTRMQSFRAYYLPYHQHRNSFAQLLVGNAKAALALARVRGFKTALEAALFKDDLPLQAFTTALESCQLGRHVFHRYFRARAQLLNGADSRGGVPLNEWDVYAPLSSHSPKIDYDTAREMVIKALSPLGREYVEAAHRGLYTERWIDVHPAPNKYNNAFSTGAYGARPYILLNWSPSMTEVGTLAHEVGHSVHTQRAANAQPYCYSDYTSTVAETASNLNQVLLRASVLPRADRDLTLAVIDEGMYFAHRYLFLFPALSGVEHELHSRYANDSAMGAEDLVSKSLETFTEAYAGTVAVDPVGTGMKWAPFVHFYEPYYFFKYAIGISAAMDIGTRILSGEAGLAEKYLQFLDAGTSRSPCETFALVGVDITKPEVYERAFKVVEGYVEKLEALALS